MHHSSCKSLSIQTETIFQDRGSSVPGLDAEIKSSEIPGSSRGNILTSMPEMTSPE